MKKSQVGSSISHGNQNSRGHSPKAQNSISTDKKHKYLLFLKEQQQLQRQKVKEQIHKKLVLQKKQKQIKLKHQLQTKRKQFQQLQKQKPEGEGDYHRGFELAKIKEQNDQLRKQLQNVQQQANNTKSQFRYLQAMKWLQKQNQDRNQYIKVAMQRRKTVQQTQKIERSKATQYQKQKQALEKSRVPKELIPFTKYKQPLGRIAYSKNYSVCSSIGKRSSNPILIVQQNNQVPNQAEALAQGQHALKRAQSIKRQCQSARNQKVANERYKQALLKMKRQKQLQQYEREVEKSAKEYNLSRIHAGKTNQYTGIKPATMKQIKTNKVNRSQQQFEKIFFNKNNPQFKANRIANHHQIIQARNKLKQFNQVILAKKDKSDCNKKIKNNNTSLINEISQGKYSFESSDHFARTKTQQNQDVHQEQYQEIAERTEQQEISQDQLNPKQQHNMYELTPEVIKQYRKQKNLKNQRQQTYKNTKKTQQFSFKPNMRQAENNVIHDVINTKKLQKTKCQLSNICQNKYQYEDDESQDSNI